MKFCWFFNVKLAADLANHKSWQLPCVDKGLSILAVIPWSTCQVFTMKHKLYEPAISPCQMHSSVSPFITFQQYYHISGVESQCFIFRLLKNYKKQQVKHVSQSNWMWERSVPFHFAFIIIINGCWQWWWLCHPFLHKNYLAWWWLAVCSMKCHVLKDLNIARQMTSNVWFKWWCCFVGRSSRCCCEAYSW